MRSSFPASITFHSLRHTFASWLVECDVDINTVQELIGHSSLESTQLYVHAYDPKKRSALDKSSFLGLKTGETAEHRRG